MHDIRFIRENPDAFDNALKRRGLEPQAQRLIGLDEERRAKILALETAQARRNAASKEIGEAKKKKDEAKASALMAEVAALKDSMPALEASEKERSKELNDALAEIPNLPADDVPEGKDASDNVERHHFGAKREYAFTPKQHFDLGEALGEMDFETAAKLSGARFVVLKKGLARLERALGQFFLDVHTCEPHNYTEVAPPLLVRSDTMFGTAQLPKFKEDQFETSRSASQADELFDNMIKEGFKNAAAEVRDQLGRGENAATAMKNFENVFTTQIPFWRERFDRELAEQLKLWLIPTAEVPLTNLVRESILDEAQLPLRYTACTPCFRAEAGAAGKDTRGMIR
ncbi:MAG TPA: aminoacyl--tRNA ligase-related protein, partial [Xanthobacteraceae bacterium]|nr:aminoacyl--tRNA ligase-related protein [Xanthobacteraceae bacterium]